MAAPHLVREWGSEALWARLLANSILWLPRMLYQHHLPCCAHCTLLLTYNYSILNDIYFLTAAAISL